MTAARHGRRRPRRLPVGRRRTVRGARARAPGRHRRPVDRLAGRPDARRRRATRSRAATDAHAYPQTVGTPAAARGDRRLVRAPSRRAGPRRRATCCRPSARRSSSRCCRCCSVSARATSSCTRARRTRPTRSARGSSGRPRRRPTTPPSGRPARGSSGSTRPGNPDGRVLDADALRAAVARARELGAVIASRRVLRRTRLGGAVGRRADPVGPRPARDRGRRARHPVGVLAQQAVEPRRLPRRVPRRGCRDRRAAASRRASTSDSCCPRPCRRR